MSATRLLLPVFGLLLLAGEAAGLAAQYRRDLTGFVAVALIQGALWAAAAVTVRHTRPSRPMTAMVLGVAVLLRLGALSVPVFLSTDIYRYVWDGRVAAAGINPYRYVPDDPQLAALRDAAVYPHINRANYAPTIYPPMAQILFLLADRLGGTVTA
ncbi:MAG TPA: hypothetical protein VGF07_04605, partial [Stellaceae bacterium]